MATRSYSQRTIDSETPALTMSWMLEGGRLRLRWVLTVQQDPFNVNRFESVSRPTGSTQRVVMPAA